MPFQSGARLGTYEVLGPPGAGGMGTVYRARDTRLNRQVAIKTLSSALTPGTTCLVLELIEGQSLGEAHSRPRR